MYRLLLIAAALGASTAAPDRYADRHGPAAHHRPRRRSYYQAGWPAQQLDSESYLWKPPTYQLTRPYFIPVFGVQGQAAIYYPPQPLLLNPGTPPKNPMPPFKGPKYLPPTTEKPPTVTFAERADMDDDDDEAPVWPDVPAAASRPQGARPQGVVPTRAPKTSDAPTFPPLVHDIAGGPATNHLSAAEAEKAGRPSGPRPGAGGFAVAPPAAVAAPPRPSNCVWAIVACCSAETSAAPAACFEERGCSGPFWGKSPCDSEYAKQAVDAALKYYTMQARSS